MSLEMCPRGVDSAEKRIVGTLGSEEEGREQARGETGLGQEGTPFLPGVGEGETRSQSWPVGGFGAESCRSCCREVLVFSAE